MIIKTEKEKCFILALDGDVDFDPPALDLVLNRLLRLVYINASAFCYFYLRNL